MKKLTASSKRQVTSDWNKLFPAFDVYEPLWLVRRFGPILQGICLNRDSMNASYLPTAHIHNLCRRFPVVALSLAQPVVTERSGVSDRVSMEFHDQKFRDSARRLSAQSLLPLDRPLSLTEILEACRRYQTLNRPDATYPVRIFEDIILLLAWAGKPDEANIRLDEMLSEIARWPDIVMQRDGGLNSWGTRFREWISKREELRAIVEEQAATLKVAKIRDNKLASV